MPKAKFKVKIDWFCKTKVKNILYNINKSHAQKMSYKDIIGLYLDNLTWINM